MTEKQRPRTSSIVSSLQKFKRTSVSADAGKHNQGLIEQNSIQQDTTPSTRSSLPVNNSHRKTPWCHVFLPLPAQISQSTKAKSKEKEEGSRSQTRLLSFHAPHLSLPLKRSQTATMCRPYSRIPTPTKPPQGAAYSQTVYQDEGRRSVLSSVGRRRTSFQTRRASEKEQHNDNDMERKKIPSDGKFQEIRDREHDPCSSYPRSGTAAASSSSVARQSRREDTPNNGITHFAVQNTISRSHTMLPVREATATTLIPGLNMPEQPRYQRRRSLPAYSHSGRRPNQTQTQDESSALASKAPTGISRPRAEHGGSQTRGQIEEYEKSEKTRKARARASIGATISSDPSVPRPGTNRLFGTGTFAASRLPGINNSLENPSTNTARERTRMLERAERMAQRATISNVKTYPSTLSSNILDENEPPGHRTNTQQRPSRSPTRFLHQVAHSQPRQYWLGRFVTLVNAFNYEDSFHQPDAATGFGMISSYSRPLGSAERLLPDYRTKRAFMVLENACVTDEANQSLREFQDEYISIHGDRWMG